MGRSAAGLLTGTIAKDTALEKDDIRLQMPRFQGANREQNLALVARLEALARAEHCTPSQLAIAWVLGRGDFIVPIVGTSKPQRLTENAAAAALRPSEATLDALDEAFPIGAAAGARTVPELLPRLGL